MDCFKGKSIGTKLGPWLSNLGWFFGPFSWDEPKPVPGPRRPGKCPVQSSPSALPFATLVPGYEHLQHPEALGNVVERFFCFQTAILPQQNVTDRILPLHSFASTLRLKSRAQSCCVWCVCVCPARLYSGTPSYKYMINTWIAQLNAEWFMLTNSNDSQPHW